MPNSDLLNHLMDLKASVAAQTALLHETKHEIKSISTKQDAIETRVHNLEIWPKTGKILISIAIGLAAVLSSLFGIVKAVLH